MGGTILGDHAPPPVLAPNPPLDQKGKTFFPLPLREKKREQESVGAGKENTRPWQKINSGERGEIETTVPVGESVGLRKRAST